MGAASQSQSHHHLPLPVPEPFPAPMSPALRLLESWRSAAVWRDPGSTANENGGLKTDASKFLGPEPAPIHAEIWISRDTPDRCSYATSIHDSDSTVAPQTDAQS